MHAKVTPSVNKQLHRRLLTVVGAVALLLVGGAIGAYWASRQPTRFYLEAISASSAETTQHGEHFERAVLAVHNNAQHAGRWETSFTADEINAWLATDLPAKFPRLLPAGVSEPRVAIDGDGFHFAVRYQRGG